MTEKTFATFFARQSAINFGVPVALHRRGEEWVVTLPESDDGISF
jgi:hypothetical protein